MKTEKKYQHVIKVECVFATWEEAREFLNSLPVQASANYQTKAKE